MSFIHTNYEIEKSLHLKGMKFIHMIAWNKTFPITINGMMNAAQYWYDCPLKFRITTILRVILCILSNLRGNDAYTQDIVSCDELESVAILL